MTDKAKLAPPVFVWLRGLRGPEPQIWTRPFVGSRPSLDRILAQRDLTPAESLLSLDQLSALYPAPAYEV